jgi:purine-nucleoside phosphorylase
MNEPLDNIQEAVAFLRTKTSSKPSLAIILGSGLGPFADTLLDRVEVPTSAIPHYPASTVVGHSGRLVFGRMHGREVMAVSGRVHYYEGYSIEQVSYAVRLMAAMSVRSLIITNAAGGVNPTFRPGDLMLITSHVNFMFANPLRGPNDESAGPRFPDLEEDYDREYLDLAEQIAVERGIRTQRGVYAAGAGPSYETRAEVRMFRFLGADAVGMSTVPEVLVARHRGIRILGISCITNLGTGLSAHRLSHEEVTETAQRVKASFEELIGEVIRRMPVT